MIDEEEHSDEATEKRWSNWEPEEGYHHVEEIHNEVPHGVDVEEAKANESLPRRSIAPGLHSGLTVLLNVEKEEYYCSGTESMGFKVRWLIFCRILQELARLCKSSQPAVVETSAYDPEGPVAQCKCLPACTEMRFPFSMSQSKLNSAKNLKLSAKLKADFPKLEDDTFVQENIAVVHFYHDNLHFLKHERGEVPFNFIKSSSKLN